MKKRKRKSGTRRLAQLLFVLGGALVFCAGPSHAGDKKEKRPESFTVIAGTVFRDSGFALAEADVTLQAADTEGNPKGKKQSFTCNHRGEFAFRLPGQEGKFVVTAAAKGFGRQQKIVDARTGERSDITFTLTAKP